MSHQIAQPQQTMRPKAPARAKRERREGDDPQYLAALRQLPCAADRTYTGDVEAHHCTHLSSRGLSQKVPDRFCIPLSQARHDELHRAGTRRHAEVLASPEWNVDAEALANELWRIWCHEPADRRLEMMRRAVMEHGR